MTDITIFPPLHRIAPYNIRCAWCGELIMVLAPYLLTRGIFDGVYEQMSFHMDCFNAGAKIDHKELEQTTKYFKRGTIELREEEDK
jgi:hypothetical protein